MSKKKSKGIKINEKSNPKNEEMRWDNLKEVYIETTGLIGEFGRMLANIDMTYGKVICTDTEVTKEYLGSTKVLNEFTIEITDILATHSKEVNKDGKKFYAPYTGIIKHTDDKAIEAYINIIVAYEGVTDRIQKVMEQTGSHLLGKVNALQIGKVNASQEKVLKDGK